MLITGSVCCVDFVPANGNGTCLNVQSAADVDWCTPSANSYENINFICVLTVQRNTSLVGYFSLFVVRL